MNKTASRYVIGTALGLTTFLSGIIGTYEMGYLGRNVPVPIALLIRGAVALGMVALLYAILCLTWKPRSATLPKYQSRAAILLVAIVFWLSFPVIGVVPKTIASLFPGFVIYGTDNFYGYVLVLGTLVISGIIWSQIILRLYSLSMTEPARPA